MFNDAYDNLCEHIWSYMSVGAHLLQYAPPWVPENTEPLKIRMKHGWRYLTILQKM